MGLSRSSTRSNIRSRMIAPLLMMVLSISIRVDSFCTVKRNRKFCRHTAMCPPLLVGESDIEILEEFRERQLREAILEDQFLSEDVVSPGSDMSSSFVSLSLVGQSKLPLATSESESEEESKKDPQTSYATVLVITPTKSDTPSQNSDGTEETNEPNPVMFLPLAQPTDSRLRLLSQAYVSEPISSFSNLIPWNLNLINRDNSLFDNIPWNQWSKDPDLKNRDAALNLVDQKFRYGKRDAYNRFTGKDVNAKTVAESKRRYWQKKLVSSLDETSSDNDDDYDSTFSQSFLSKRVLELRIQELRMEIADVDSQLAISRTTGSDNLVDLEESRSELVQSLQETEGKLKDLLSFLSRSLSSSSDASSEDVNILDKIARWALDISMKYRTEQNDAPYRGATGYAPRLSDVNDDADVEFYRSPFDLLNEILSDQLNAEVIECVLENTSWLGGTIALGGAVVLRRRTPTIETTLMGEKLQTPDRDEDFGNLVKGGEIFVVECDVDEAIGVALSSGLPIRVEQTIFERASMMGIRVEDSENDGVMSKFRSIKQKLPYWNVLDSGIALDVEGDPANPETSRLSPISIPRTTSSLFDSIFEPTSNSNGDNSASSSMFPNDNPITSINQFDSLGNKGKAKTLLEMSNFSGRLPRPRTVRKAPATENPLDKLLLPLIDESVRNEYNIREAERRGDFDIANELRSKKSNRQKAKERVEIARTEGNEELAQEWETEAEFLEGLRADVTQDEGSYSRFLDKDDWYERDRKRTANRAKRSSFGNLLDGIE